MTGEVMNVDELAIYLKMKKPTIYKHVEQERLPHFRVGGSLRFRKNTIDKWIEEQEKCSVRS
ncbi:MAG: helix-turn-helix domain-containing protein [Candidatus Omnitrophica bacterium]|nr:helix-turn-helix domain-containing protein [Candidatus Omnitrophota bacterium]